MRANFMKAPQVLDFQPAWPLEYWVRVWTIIQTFDN
jgi:hypothetical protein